MPDFSKPGPLTLSPAQLEAAELRTQRLADIRTDRLARGGRLAVDEDLARRCALASEELVGAWALLEME